MFHQISEGSGSILCTEFHIRTQSRFIAIVVLMKGSLFFIFMMCSGCLHLHECVLLMTLWFFFIMHIQVPGCLCVFLLLFWGRFNEEINLHDWHFFFVLCYHFWSNKHCVSVKPSFSEIPTCSVKFMNWWMGFSHHSWTSNYTTWTSVLISVNLCSTHWCVFIVS